MSSLASPGLEKCTHDFVRDNDKKRPCEICNNLWPLSDGLVAKLFVCSTCGIYVHSACRAIAAKVMRCPAECKDSFEIRNQSASNIISGSLKISFRQIFDMPVVAGTSVYAVCRSSYSDSECIIQSNTVTVGEKGDVTWDLSLPNLSPYGDIVRFDRRNSKDSSTTIDFVHLEVWKSFMAVFDSKVASCPVNILPFLQYQKVSDLERWFPLTTVDGQLFGNILVSVTNTTSINSSPPRRKPENVSAVETESTPKPQPLKSIESHNSLDNDNTLSSQTPRKDKIDTLHDNIKFSHNKSTEERGNINIIKSDNIPTERRNSRSSVETIKPVNKNTIDEKVSSPPKIIDRNMNALTSPNLLVTPPLDSKTQFEKVKTTQPRNLDDDFKKVLKPESKLSSFISDTFNFSSSTNDDDDEDDFDLYKDSFTNEVISSEPLLKPEQNQTSPIKNQQPVALTSENESAPLSNISKFLQVPDNISAWQKYVQSLSNSAYGYVDSVIRQPKKSDESLESVSTSYVGEIYVDLKSAFKYDVSDAGQGNYCVIASINDSSQHELRSKIIYNSATPIFNAKWIFTVPHFRSVLKLSLIETVPSEKKVGESIICLYSLIQQESDKYFSRSKSTSKESDRNIPIKDVNDKSKVIGHFDAKVVFKEDIQGLYLNYWPRIAALGPQEPLSVERLTVHIARFQAIVDLVSGVMKEYQKIVEWDDAPLTFVCVVVFVFSCLKINAEYSLCGPTFLVLLLLTRSLIRRKTGAFTMKFVDPSGKQKKPTVDLNEVYQPYALLRVSVLGFKKTGNTSNNASGPNTSLSITSLSGHYFANSGASTNTSKSSIPISALNKSSIRFSYVSMNSLPLANDIRSKKKHQDIQPDLSSQHEYYIGCFRPSNQSSREGSSNLSKLMSSLKLPGVPGLMGAGGFKDPSVLHNMFEPWPLIEIDSVSRKNCSADASCDFPMKEISLVYPMLQPVLREQKDPPTPGKQTANKNESIKLSRDISDFPEDELLDLGNHSAEGEQGNSSTTDSNDKNILKLVPWDKNDSYIKGMIYLDDTYNSSASSENLIGFISIPIFELLNEPSNEYFDFSPDDIAYPILEKRDIAYSGPQREIRRWFQIKKDLKDMKQQQAGRAATPQEIEDSRSRVTSFDSSITNMDDPSISVQLRLQLDIRNKHDGKSYSTEDIESSRALRHLLFHNTNDGKGQSSTITALWNMRDHIVYVQNFMSWILDLVESFKNIFNWTTPKTTVLYLMVIGLWITTMIIPGRYLILMVGLHQFFYKFMPDPEGKQMLEKLHNVVQSIPNDDDLYQYYQEERTSFAEAKKSALQSRLKRATLGLGFKCLWDGKVLMKLSSTIMPHIVSSSHYYSTSSSLSNPAVSHDEWEEYYLVLQGNRLAWWRSCDDLVDGQKQCDGQLLLYNGPASGGVSGITQTSPVDIREMKDAKRLLAIFGCDEHGMPMKCTIFCDSPDDCQLFHKQISSVLGNH